MIEGIWYPYNSNRAYKATFEIIENKFKVNIDTLESLHGETLKVQVDEKIANTKRTIKLPDGSRFVASHHPLFDEIKPRSNFLDKLESNSKYIISSAIGVALFSIFFVFYLLPTISDSIADTMPPQAKQLISNSSKKYLDKEFFAYSKLSNEKRKILQDDFKKIITSLKLDKQGYTLHIRELKINNQPIANAFAFPSGDIFITDELINQTTSYFEINAIVLHEIGHVQHNHGLKKFVRNSMISLLLMSMLGDTNFLNDLGVAMGTFVVNNSYSQEFEQEADVYAFQKMLLLNIDPKHFTNILSKISQNHTSKSDLSHYLSTHPSDQSRIELANKFHECYKSRQIECK